jgi:isopentenyl phosphate kinase
MDLYIVKLGGSVITNKAGNKFEVNPRAIARIAKEIKSARKKKKFSLILVHGAGPFGHTMVAKYGINNGIKTQKQIEGFVATHNKCRELDEKVVEILNKTGLCAVGIDPFLLILQKNKKIAEFHIGPIYDILDMGCIPVLYGTMVTDLKLNGSVVSGDAIVPYLAKKMQAKKVFLGTDVQGIYDSNPRENKKAKLIPEINSRNFKKIISGVSGSKAIDVTAGMKGKLEKLLEIKKTKIFIFGLNKNGNLYNLLTRKKVKCTEILFK